MVCTPEQELGLRSQDRAIASENKEFLDPFSVAIVDAKSLFDSSATEQAQGECDRSALEMAVIQESISKVSGRIRWVPHNVNPCDALTKVFSKCHLEPLMRMLRTHLFKIQEESEVLAKGKQSLNRLKSRG